MLDRATANSAGAENPVPGAVPFDRAADRYDAWFDDTRGRRIFDVEAECMRGLLMDAPRPWLEVGVGTGRFAEALRVDEGVDPSRAVLPYAERRGIRVRPGAAEQLPYTEAHFGAAILIVTICFVRDPQLALAEARRVVRADGCVLVGLVPANSPWGRDYARKSAEGHAFYSVARFYTVKRILGMAASVGLYSDRQSSCLFEAPEEEIADYRSPVEGIVKGAGFVGLRFKVEAP